ncbi:hypothetical protein Tco_0012371 [Tanacetum coccineum]
MIHLSQEFTRLEVGRTETAALSITKDGVRGITATIDRKGKVFVSEASIRRHLKLEDSEGLKTLPTAEIFEQLALMGFIQIFLNKRKRMLLPHKRTFPTPTLTQKLFSNMKRASKGYSGVDIPLFPTMLTTPESSPSRITSSPSLSPQTHSSTSQPPSTPPSNQTTPVTEEAALMPHESPLQSVHSLRRDEGSLSLNELTDLYTSLSKKKLEQTIKTSQARRRVKFLISDDEEAEEDPFNQGRSLIEELDLDAGISLVPPHDADQGRFDATPISDQPEEQLGDFSVATALADATRRSRSVENVQTYTRRRREVSIGSGGVSAASRLVSTVDISSANELDSTTGLKAKDKGKAIMHKKLDLRHNKNKKGLTLKQPWNCKSSWMKEKKLQLMLIKLMILIGNQGGCKMSHFKGMGYEDIRPIFERVWDQNQAFIPMGSEIEKEKSLARKRVRETLSEESAKKQKLEDDTEKEELQVYLNIFPEDESLDVK